MLEARSAETALTTRLRRWGSEFEGCGFGTAELRGNTDPTGCRARDYNEVLRQNAIATPEPAVLALIAPGLLAVGGPAIRRRRSQR